MDNMCGWSVCVCVLYFLYIIFNKTKAANDQDQNRLCQDQDLKNQRVRPQLILLQLSLFRVIIATHFQWKRSLSN